MKQKFYICVTLSALFISGCKGFADHPGYPHDYRGVDQPSIEETTEDTVGEVLGTAALYGVPVILASAYDSSRELVGASIRSEDNARGLYKQGEKLFQAKKFRQANSKFTAARKRWPDSPLEEDALFKIAECEFFSDNYPDAEEAYGTLLKKYSNTRYMPTCSKRMFAMGQYWLQVHAKDPSYPVTPNLFDSKRPLFDTRGHGLKMLENIIQKDPTSDLADTAAMALADSHFNAGSNYDADYYYTMVRRDYPHSKYQFQAHLRGMLTKLKLYQGPEYDDSPLLEGEKLANQLLTQFPEHVKPERQRILKIKSQIIQNRALSVWTNAKYYENRKEYKAARLTYERLAKEFPGTKFAEESRTRIAELQKMPDRGPNPIQWASQYIPGLNSKTRVAGERDQSTRR